MITVDSNVGVGVRTAHLLLITRILIFFDSVGVQTLGARDFAEGKAP